MVSSFILGALSIIHISANNDGINEMENRVGHSGVYSTRLHFKFEGFVEIFPKIELRSLPRIRNFYQAKRSRIFYKILMSFPSTDFLETFQKANAKN